MQNLHNIQLLNADCQNIKLRCNSFQAMILVSLLLLRKDACTCEPTTRPLKEKILCEHRRINDKMESGRSGLYSIYSTTASATRLERPTHFSVKTKYEELYAASTLYHYSGPKLQCAAYLLNCILTGQCSCNRNVATFEKSLKDLQIAYALRNLPNKFLFYCVCKLLHEVLCIIV
eukprot:284815029_6